MLPLLFLRINRNIVECKDILHIGRVNFLPGINRNIVECKVLLPSVYTAFAVSINRNIVECKEYVK